MDVITVLASVWTSLLQHMLSILILRMSMLLCTGAGGRGGAGGRPAAAVPRRRVDGLLPAAAGRPGDRRLQRRAQHLLRAGVRVLALKCARPAYEICQGCCALAPDVSRWHRQCLLAEVSISPTSVCWLVVKLSAMDRSCQIGSWIHVPSKSDSHLFLASMIVVQPMHTELLASNHNSFPSHHNGCCSKTCVLHM